MKAPWLFEDWLARQDPETLAHAEQCDNLACGGNELACGWGGKRCLMHQIYTARVAADLRNLKLWNTAAEDRTR